jgi:predicted RND superfamily exporter protein
MRRASAGFERYIDWVCRHRGAVVLALLAVTVFWGSRLPGLRVEIDPDANLPQDHPYIQALHTLEDKFGEKNLVVVGLFPKDGNVFTPAFLTKLQRITRRIGEMPGLIRSTYLGLATPLAKAIEGDADTLLVRPLLDGTPTSDAAAAEVRRRAFVNPLYVGTVIAADGSATAIIANFRLSAELPGYSDIQDRLETILREENDGTFTVHFGGPVAVLAAMAHVTERTVLLFPFAVLVVAFIHYEAFRTVQGMVLPLLTAVLAVVWSLGLMGLLRVPLDPFNTTTPILILAVAAGHAVQILKRYYEEYDRHRDTTAAVRIAVLRVGPVMVTAGVIAALSFFSLTVFATATVRNFGLLTGFGIVSALVIELTLIPALRLMLPAPRAGEMAREARAGQLLEGGLGRLSRLVSARPAAVVAGTLAIAACALLAATRVRVDTSFKRQFGATHPVRIADDALNAAFGGTNTLIFLVDGARDGALHDPGVLAAIARLQSFVASDPAVGKTLSIVDFLREMQRALHGGDPAAAVIPPSPELVSQYLLLYSMAGGP